MDNGFQFDSKAFRRYCCDLEIKNRYFTPAYPQGNGQAEAVNKVIVSGLKKRLDDAKGKWVEELSNFLWTYWTTPRRSTGETPFSMTYGTKVVIPLETGFLTLRTSSFTSNNNDELLDKSLDLVEERRENATVHLAYYQHKLKQGYDANNERRENATSTISFSFSSSSSPSSLLVGREEVDSPVASWSGKASLGMPSRMV